MQTDPFLATHTCSLSQHSPESLMKVKTFVIIEIKGFHPNPSIYPHPNRFA